MLHFHQIRVRISIARISIWAFIFPIVVSHPQHMTLQFNLQMLSSNRPLCRENFQSNLDYFKFDDYVYIFLWIYSFVFSWNKSIFYCLYRFQSILFWNMLRSYAMYSCKLVSKTLSKYLYDEHNYVMNLLANNFKAIDSEIQFETATKSFKVSSFANFKKEFLSFIISLCITII